MPILISLLGGIQMLVGVLTILVAKSAFHEITAAILFGLGVVALALGSIMDEIAKRQP